MSAFLQVRDLHVQFPTEDGVVRAVDGVSFDLERGRTLAIVGESGSGKSVTAQAIMGLLNRSVAKVTGSILLDGADLVPMDDDEIRLLRGKQMSMVFQDPMSSLHPYYRVGDQLVELATDLAGTAGGIGGSFLEPVQLLEDDHRNEQVMFLEAEQAARIVHQHVGIKNEDFLLH